MAARVKKIQYCYMMIPNRPGQGVRVLEAIKDAGVSLASIVGFPGKSGKVQLDLVAERLAPVRRLAAKQGWKLSRIKRGFLIQGEDRAGAVHRHLRRLADRGVSVTAASAVAAGGGRFGMMLWVKPRDYARASRALGAH